MNREARRGKGWTSREKEKETRLRTGKTTKTTEKKQLHQRSQAKKNQKRRNHMITPPRTPLFFSFFTKKALCTAYANNV